MVRDALQLPSTKETVLYMYRLPQWSTRGEYVLVLANTNVIISLTLGACARVTIVIVYPSMCYHARFCIYTSFTNPKWGVIPHGILDAWFVCISQMLCLPVLASLNFVDSKLLNFSQIAVAWPSIIEHRVLYSMYGMYACTSVMRVESRDEIVWLKLHSPFTENLNSSVVCPASAIF